MQKVPTTSITLLRELGSDAPHARWNEFIARYRPMMEGYLAANFPGLDADDIIQETLVALISVLPKYRYNPNECGYFHNYLTGIVRHKALNECAKRRKYDSLAARCIAQASDNAEAAREKEEESWKHAIYEIAIGQLMKDDTVCERTKQVFMRIAINHEEPVAVAESLGMTRNAVDQAKSRTIARLRVLADRLKSVI